MLTLCRAAALSLLLLLAQQGALVHEWAHHGLVAARHQGDDHRAAAGERCELCVAFAQIAGAVAIDDVVPVLLAGATFALPGAAPVVAVAAAPPATRSRGPPIGT